MSAPEQTPAKVLADYIDYLDEPSRSIIDGLYSMLLALDLAVLKQVLTGKRKSALMHLVDTDISELNPHDYDLENLAPNVKTVVDHVITLIDAIDAANKVSGSPGLTTAMVALTDYVAGHSAEIDTVQIDGLPFGKYLHSIAGSDECNNILASKVRPRLMAVSAGKPIVLLVHARLKQAKVIH